MQSTDFHRCVDEDLISADPDIRHLAIRRLHIIMFGQGEADETAAHTAVLEMAERLVQVLKEHP